MFISDDSECFTVRRSTTRPQSVPRQDAAATVLEDQPDYDHLAQWKKSLDEGRSAPVIFTVIFFAI